MDMFMIDLSEIERYKNESWDTAGGRLPDYCPRKPR